MKHALKILLLLPLAIQAQTLPPPYPAPSALGWHELIWPAEDEHARDDITIGGDDYFVRDAWAIDCLHAEQERYAPFTNGTLFITNCLFDPPPTSTLQFPRAEQENVTLLKDWLSDIPFLLPTAPAQFTEVRASNFFSSYSLRQYLSSVWNIPTNCDAGGGASNDYLLCYDGVRTHDLQNPNAYTSTVEVGNPDDVEMQTTQIVSQGWAWDILRDAIDAATTVAIKPYFRFQSSCGTNLYINGTALSNDHGYVWAPVTLDSFSRTASPEMVNRVVCPTETTNGTFVSGSGPLYGSPQQFYTSYSISSMGPGAYRLYIKVDCYLVEHLSGCTITGIDPDYRGVYAGEVKCYGMRPTGTTVYRGSGAGDGGENSDMTLSYAADTVYWSATLRSVQSYWLGGDGCSPPNLYWADGGVVEGYVDLTNQVEYRVLNLNYD